MSDIELICPKCKSKNYQAILHPVWTARCKDCKCYFYNNKFEDGD